VTEQPGWESPGGTPGEPVEPPRPPLTPEWAAEQPPPQGWGHPGYGQQPGAPPPPPPPPPPGQQQGWGGPGPQYGWGTPAQAAWQPPKPGVIPLRPLGVGEILDGAISTIRANPRLMLGLSALVAVVTQVVTVPISWALLHNAGDHAFSFGEASSTQSAESDLALTASSLAASVTQFAITLVATLLLTGMLTVVLSRAVLGQDIDAKQAWTEAKPRLPALIGVTVLVFLIELGLGIALLGPGLAIAAAGGPGAAVALTLLVGIPLFCFLAVYLYVAFALAPAVVVLEKQSVVASLRRSRRLVKGAWWRTFGILLLVNIIAAIVGNIFQGIFLFAAYIAGGAGAGFENFNPYELAPLIITGVGAIVGAAITWPFTAVASALIYVDRRMRREGLDLELARAAGYVPPGQSATPGTPLQTYGPPGGSYGPPGGSYGPQGGVHGSLPPPAAPPPPPYDG
jgi:hypothetical protein